LRGGEVHARVGDALAIRQARQVTRVLTASHQEALQHHAHDAALASGHLRRDRARYIRLSTMILATVPVSGVNDDPARQSSPFDHLQRPGHARRVEVRTAAPATQDHMAVQVPGTRDKADGAHGRDAQERVATRGGQARVRPDLDVPVGRVLEPGRHRQARGQVPVHLALGGPRADGRPGHRISEVCGDDRVNPLTGSGNPERGQADQQLPRLPEPAAHVVATIQGRVVEEAGPAGHGAGLFRVGPHDDQQLTGQAHRRQPCRVLQSGLRFVD
jgi:hypothetical protein